MTATPPPLAPDLEAALRRLRLSAIRKLSPELLVTAKTCLLYTSGHGKLDALGTRCV